MRMMNHKAIQSNGFAVDSIPEACEFVVGAALQIGRVYKPDAMPLVQTLTPKTVQMAPANTYSGNYGLGDFPFHTDMAHWHVPPRYLLLICIIPDERVSTKLIHWSDIQREIDPGCISKARYMPRRRLNDQMYRLRIQDGQLNRWDPLFIKPANLNGHLLKKRMEKIDLGSKSTSVTLSRPGDMLLLDNWQVMHSRSTVCEGSPRIVKRVYLSELN